MMVIPWVSLLLCLGIFRALLYVALTWWRVWRSVAAPQLTSVKTKRPPRSLKPRTPTDSPACVASSSTVPVTTSTIAVRPWREVKSSRRRPKQIETEGYACAWRDCKYRGITNSRLHALVG